MNNSLKIEIFMELLEQHENYLKRFIYSRVYNSQDAEDIFQDTIYNAFKSFEQLRDKNSFNSWINQIAFHVICAKFKKKENYFKMVLLDEIKEQDRDLQVFSSTYSVEEEVIRNFDKINVREWLLKLSYKQRVFFYYYYEVGLTIEKIGEILDVKVSTLWALHSRMKEKLRRKEEFNNERDR